MASYVIQYDYIVNELCVNRDKPQLGCNGKCHLMKEMAASSALDQKQSKDYKFPVLENISFVSDWYEVAMPQVVSEAIIHVFYYSNQYQMDVAEECFQPPVISFSKSFI